eukprot:11200653-Lingulodinium_polyedra.AAC.1
MPRMARSNRSNRSSRNSKGELAEATATGAPTPATQALAPSEFRYAGSTCVGKQACRTHGAEAS